MDCFSDEVSVMYQENTTQPSESPGGIQDNRGNLCFIISSLHTLCRTVKLDKLKVLCPGRFTSLLMKTKDLLDSKGVDGRMITDDVWHMIEEFWPEYIKLDDIKLHQRFNMMP